MDSSLNNHYIADITPADVAVWTLNRVEETNCRRLVKRELHMSDKPEPVNPNLKGFDSLPFDRAGEVVTGILLESISPQEALRILKAIPDRKGEGVDLVLDQLPSGTVKVRLEQGKDLAEVPEGINTPAVPWRRKDFGALVFNPDRIVTRQVPNVLPDLQLDGSAKK